MAKFLSFGLALVAILTCQCMADDLPRSYSPQPSYQQAPMPYQFSWNVLDDYSKNNYGQDEKSDGSRTSGSYYVALPDGRLQKVTYSVDGDSGYKADVTYEGEASITSYQQPAASSYKPVQVVAPRTYSPVVAESQQAPVVVNSPAPVVVSNPAPVVVSNPAPKTYEPTPSAAPAPSFEPIASASTVDSSNAQPGEVYYKPLENAPEPEIYYKPLPEAEASAPEVYYKPVPSDYQPTQ